MYLREEKSFPDVSQATAQSTRERLLLLLREQDISLLCLTQWNKSHPTLDGKGKIIRNRIFFEKRRKRERNRGEKSVGFGR